jgi:hypothetical protein
MAKYSLFIKEAQNKSWYIVVKDNEDMSIYFGKIVLPKLFVNKGYFFNFLLKNTPTFEQVNQDKMIVLYFYKHNNIVNYIEFILTKDYVYL